jgi:hypothetical protein
MSNTTSPIKPVTTGTSGTGVNIATALGLTSASLATSPQCQSFAVQNNSAGNAYVKESAAAALADSIKIGPDVYWTPALDPNGNGYDLREFWLDADANTVKLIVFRRIS